jgi:hypothetical protein
MEVINLFWDHTYSPPSFPPLSCRKEGEDILVKNRYSILYIIYSPFFATAEKGAGGMST